MIETFEEKAVPYQLRSTSNLNLPKVRTTDYGTDTVKFMGQRAWAKLPKEIKSSSSLISQKNVGIATVGSAKLLFMD